jgi:hypothetical protein
MKKILSIAVLALFLGGIVGCGSSSTTAPVASPSGSPAKSSPSKS